MTECHETPLFVFFQRVDRPFFVLRGSQRGHALWLLSSAYSYNCSDGFGLECAPLIPLRWCHESGATNTRPQTPSCCVLTVRMRPRARRCKNRMLYDSDTRRSNRTRTDAAVGCHVAALRVACSLARLLMACRAYCLPEVVVLNHARELA